MNMREAWPRISILLVTLFCIACLASYSSASAQPESQGKTLVYIEVRMHSVTGITTKYIPLSDDLKITLDIPKDVHEVEIRVDSLSPFKPLRVKGEDASYVIIEDYAYIKVGKAGLLIIYFRKAEPKTPVYLLQLGSRVEVYGGGNITLTPQGEWNVWGVIISVLTRGKPPKFDVNGPISLLNSSMHKIQTAVGEIEAKEYVYLTHAQKLTVEGDVLSLIYTPIYYRPVIGSEVVGPAVAYVNAPGFASVEVGSSLNVTELPLLFLARFLRSNPRIVNVTEVAEISWTVSPVTLELGEGLESLVIQASTENGKVEGERKITVTPPLTSPLHVRVLTPEGDLIGEYKILSLPPRAVLPVELYDLYVELLDSDGKPLRNATLYLYKALRKISVKVDRIAEIRGLPPGAYVLSVEYMGVEVAREVVNLYRDMHLMLRCNARRIKVRVLMADATPINTFVLRVKSINGSVIFEGKGVNGEVEIPPLPYGTYTVEILRNGTKLYSCEIDVSKRREYVFSLPFYKVTVKVLSYLGTPIPGAEVVFKSSSGEESAAYTGRDGKAVFPLVREGEYTVIARIGGLEARRELKVYGVSPVYLSVRTDVLFLIGGFAVTPSLALAFMVLLVVIAVVLIIKRLIHRGAGVIVLKA